MGGRLFLFLSCLVFAGPASASASVTVEMLCEIVETAAKLQPTAQSAAPIELATTDGSMARVTLRPPTADWRVAVAKVEDRQGSPALLARIMPPCRLIEARRLQRDTTGAVTAVEILESDLATVRNREPANPPVPELAAGNGRARFAHVDTGVNYLLPQVRERLASDAAGRLLGYDFWEMTTVRLTVTRAAIFSCRFITGPPSSACWRAKVATSQSPSTDFPRRTCADFPTWCCIWRH